jgi:integrase
VASIRSFKTDKGGERRYEVRWREDGQAKSKTLTTQADARHFKTETERRLRMGVLHNDSAKDFGTLEDEFVERYTAGLEGSRRPRVKTLESLETTRAHLKPLRNVKVDKIDLARLEQLVLPIAAQNPRTAEMTMQLAKRILRSSAKRKQPINPSALEAHVAKSIPREAVFLTWDQVRDVESYMPEFIRRIVPIAVLTLCRQGELLGLRDHDLDEANATITITGQAQDGKRVTTKTAAGRRTVDLSPLMLDLIREQQKARPQTVRDGLLFPNRKGRVFDRHHFYRRYYKPAAVNAGVRDLTFHGLRHTGASLMIAADINVKTISERMGHTDGGALVLRTYGHLYKGRGKDAALKLEQLVTGGIS